MDYSLVQQFKKQKVMKISVLILVVMDYSLVRGLTFRLMVTLLCLNPCCNGL